ncbi:putative NADH-ubiquinone oxidoreductase chain 4L [Trichinella spiralis]|uniref:putative NADH-ubiquinone oxidoreductase chain 4L n=1 Tax=Trichinella spiralis TaxID=6334 RepID=UPI0001EFBF82|nr:putative NADH-ubiquinone oxidoreductase chain 4L [Trichinella spiralis]
MLINVHCDKCCASFLLLVIIVIISARSTLTAADRAVLQRIVRRLMLCQVLLMFKPLQANSDADVYLPCKTGIWLALLEKANNNRTLTLLVLLLFLYKFT